MRITKVDRQNNPSFQMTISCNKSGLKALRKGAKEGYLNYFEPVREKFYEHPNFNFNKLYKEFRENFAEQTKDKEGKIILKANPMNFAKDYLMATYVGKDGKVYELADGNGAVCIDTERLLVKFPDKNPDEKPFWDSTLTVIEAAGDMFFGHGNPLHNLQVHKQWLEYFYKVSSKIVPEKFADMTYKKDYIEKVKHGVIDDVLNMSVKKV